MRYSDLYRGPMDTGIEGSFGYRAPYACLHCGPISSVEVIQTHRQTMDTPAEYEWACPICGSIDTDENDDPKPFRAIRRRRIHRGPADPGAPRPGQAEDGRAGPRHPRRPACRAVLSRTRNHMDDEQLHRAAVSLISALPQLIEDRSEWMKQPDPSFERHFAYNLLLVSTKDALRAAISA